MSFIYLFTLGGSNSKIHHISHEKGGHQISRGDHTRGEGGSGKNLVSREGGGGGLQGSHIVSRDI